MSPLGASLSHLELEGGCVDLLPSLRHGGLKQLSHGVYVVGEVQSQEPQPEIWGSSGLGVARGEGESP